MKTILPLLFLSSVAVADPIKVAVIDTGFDFNSTWTEKTRPKLCSEGHEDFTTNPYNVNYNKDNHGHGTHIAGLIAKYSNDVDYCLVILKYYDPNTPAQNNLANSLKAFKKAIDLSVDIINYSGGGLERSNLECSLIEKAIKKGITVVAAAGNESKDLHRHPYYPAMCNDDVIKVVNMSDPELTTRAPSSNWDSSNKIPNVTKQFGVNVLSILPNNYQGKMTGTSQATAIETGHRIKEVRDRKEYNKKLIERYGVNII